MLFDLFVDRAPGRYYANKRIAGEFRVDTPELLYGYERESKDPMFITLSVTVLADGLRAVPVIRSTRPLISCRRTRKDALWEGSELYHK